MRYLTLYEGRIIVIKEIEEQERSYGSQFV